MQTDKCGHKRDTFTWRLTPQGGTSHRTTYRHDALCIVCINVLCDNFVLLLFIECDFKIKMENNFDSSIAIKKTDTIAITLVYQQN